jgi:hypothetical protein
MTVSTLATRYPHVRWESDESYLHLCVAVGAQKVALGGFGARRRERAREATGTEAEALRGGIAVVKLERCDVAVVAT